ncbi:MAG: recombinase family protein [Methylococcales bacterium]|nr:recombinase family protein [Methylococcales bacterium]
MKGQNIGYIRVSSAGQVTDRQLMDIELDKIFEDKLSGKNTNRPMLQACLEHLREGDTLHVHSIDRLARDLLDLQKIINALVGKGVSIFFHKENMLFSGGNNPMQALMLQMLGAFAEFERSMINDRQKEGIAAAKARGVVFGASKKLSDIDAAKVIALVEQGADKSKVAKEFGISRPTLYKILAKNKLQGG